MIPGGDPGLPTRLDDDGLMAFDDQGGTGDLVACLHRRAAEDAGVAPAPLAEDFPGSGSVCATFFERQLSLFQAFLATIRALHADCLDDHRLVVIDKSELRLVRGFEIATRVGNRTGVEIDRQGGVGAVITDLQHRPPGNVILADALVGEFPEHGGAQLRDQCLYCAEQFIGKRSQQRLAARGEDRRQADAIGRKQA